MRCLIMAAVVGGFIISPVIQAIEKEGEVDMVLVPAGKFIMGSDKSDFEHMGGEYGNVKPLYLDEHPKHIVELPTFFIDRYEVTNGQFAQYIKATGATPPTHWAENGYLLNLRKDQLNALPVDKLRILASKKFHLDMDTHTLAKEELIKAILERLAYLDRLAVNYVSWSDAEQYCRWAGKRLPSEAEWEKADRGPNGHEFSWGDEWKPGMSNTESEQWDEGVAPVGSYQSDKSEYGVYDMTGNLSEWVMDWYSSYPGSDYKSNDFGEKFKVVKGAGWGGDGHYTLHLFERAAYRGEFPPEGSYADVGFRCATDAIPVVNSSENHAGLKP